MRRFNFKHAQVLFSKYQRYLSNALSLHLDMLLSGQFVISSVLSTAAKIWSDRRTSVTAWCYISVLFGEQRKVHPRGTRAGWPKRCEEKENLWPNFGSSFYMFFLLPLSLPSVNWASQEGCFFSPEVLTPVLHLFYFHGIFLSLSFSHHYFGLLFPILTT